MSLRRALAVLPDDRESVTAVRQVVAYLDRHREAVIVRSDISKATGVSAVRREQILAALSDAFVIDCDGDSRSGGCTYSPDTALDVEVRRFLRTSGGPDSGLQRRVDRFRGRYGQGR